MIALIYDSEPVSNTLQYLQRRGRKKKLYVSRSFYMEALTCRQTFRGEFQLEILKDFLRVKRMFRLG